MVCILTLLNFLNNLLTKTRKEASALGNHTNMSDAVKQVVEGVKELAVGKKVDKKEKKKKGGDSIVRSFTRTRSRTSFHKTSSRTLPPIEEGLR